MERLALLGKEGFAMCRDGGGKSRATDFPFRRREKHRASSPKSNPFALRLSKGRSFFLTSQEEGRYFDKLSTNGRKGVRLAALTHGAAPRCAFIDAVQDCVRSEEHTSELQSLMRISYAAFC